MKLLCLLLTIAVAGICFSAEPSPTTELTKDSLFEEQNVLQQWSGVVRDKDQKISGRALSVLELYGTTATSAYVEMIKDKDVTENTRSIASLKLGNIGRSRPFQRLTAAR